MFYLITSRIPIISEDFFRILIIGTIFYLIIHALLYSSFADKYPILKQYRFILYIIWACDLILTGVIVKFFSTSTVKPQKKEKPESIVTNSVFIPKNNLEHTVKANNNTTNINPVKNQSINNNIANSNPVNNNMTNNNLINKNENNDANNKNNSINNNSINDMKQKNTKQNTASQNGYQEDSEEYSDTYISIYDKNKQIMVEQI